MSPPKYNKYEFLRETSEYLTMIGGYVGRVAAEAGMPKLYET